MGKHFDVAAIVRPQSVKRDVQEAFVKGECQITANLPANISIKLTPCVAKEEDVKHIIKIAQRCGWQYKTGNVKLPWGDAYQRAQLIKRLDDLGRQADGNKEVRRNRDLLCEKLNLNDHRQLRNYLNLSNTIFEPYPVFLLQWQHNALELPAAWNVLLTNREEIVGFIKANPILEEFYKGASCKTSNAFLMLVCLRRRKRRFLSSSGPDCGERRGTEACTKLCEGRFCSPNVEFARATAVTGRQ